MRELFRRHEQPVVAVLMFAGWSAAYFISSYILAQGPTHAIDIPLDHAIPFIPAFVWIYLTVYMSFIIPFLVIRDTRFFRLIVLSYLSVILVSVGTFLLYPVSYPRPTFAVDSLSTWALALTYAVDKPVNCFPSLHASMAMMSALMVLEVSAPLGAIAILHTLLIGASTLFIKQHYVADIIGGFLLAIFMYYLFFHQRVTDVLRKNFGQLETTIEALINDRIDGRVRHVLDGVLESLLEKKLRERLPEPEITDGASTPVRRRVRG